MGRGRWFESSPRKGWLRGESAAEHRSRQCFLRKHESDSPPHPVFCLRVGLGGIVQDQDLSAASRLPQGERDPGAPVYLRVGAWDPARPRSRNHALGRPEPGLSVYALDGEGMPVVPEEGEWAEEDLHERLRSAEPKFLVQGRVVGRGHDGEPLLGRVFVVGAWEPPEPASGRAPR